MIKCKNMNQKIKMNFSFPESICAEIRAASKETGIPQSRLMRDAWRLAHPWPLVTEASVNRVVEQARQAIEEK